MKKIMQFGALVLLIVISVLATGCSAAQNAVSSYEEMKASVINVSKFQSNFQLIVDTGYTKIQTNNQVVTAANASNAEFIAAWADVEQSFTDSKSGYDAAKTNDPAVVDIAVLQDKGLLPSSSIPMFTSKINAYSSAISDIRLDPSITLALMATVDEAMNSIQAAGIDWNEAVADYNTIRSKVGNEVVAKIVNDLGLSDLPAQLTAYQGASAGKPITNPIAPTAPK